MPTFIRLFIMLNFFKGFFFIYFYLCALLQLLTYVYWTIFAYLGWGQLAYDVWSFHDLLHCVCKYLVLEFIHLFKLFSEIFGGLLGVNLLLGSCSSATLREQKKTHNNVDETEMIYWHTEKNLLTRSI